ncbi:MAG TPA: aldehyde oxidase, partial [Candidatus Atribacteria bacterium]|nr:aldehyde oxidase [Candidatus Atribacteria bacterium]
PYDAFIFDKKVRYVGDRVLAVLADTEEIAMEAISKIEVKYRELPYLFDPEEAVKGEVVIHDESEIKGAYDPNHNIAAAVDVEIGDKSIWSKQDVVVESEISLHYGQHTPLEPHTVLTYIDEYERLVIITSNQVPFHIRRMISILTGIPQNMIRVVKPRIGGGFGVKQEMILEDIAAFFTIRNKLPVRILFTRAEEFISSRTRHPMKIRVKIGGSKDGRINAIEMEALSNTGAYGTHSGTVLYNVGSKTLPLYNKASYVKFSGKAVYTNLPVAGAYRGYGAFQGFAGLETAIDIFSEKIGLDPLEVRKKNHIREGETSPVFKVLGEGREGTEQIIESCGLGEAIEMGKKAIGWEKRTDKRDGHGIGMAISMQGSGIPLIDMASVTIRMNDDGTFLLYAGATDIGTGSDTMLAKIVAEVLDISPTALKVFSSDTDYTPFDTGAYASSTTYVSGNAAKKAAFSIRDQLLSVGEKMLGEPVENLYLKDGNIISKITGKKVSFRDIGVRSTYNKDQFQIEANASYVGEVSPPPFSAHFVELEVDKVTGLINILKYVVAVDAGTIINPELAKGQVLGAVANGIGYAIMEEMKFDRNGRVINPSFMTYKILSTKDMPPTEVIFVNTYEPTGPYGAKSIAEVCIDGPIPAISNALYNACGIRIDSTPFTPSKILSALEDIEK